MIRINLIRGKRKKRREVNVNAVYLLIPVLVLAGLLLYHRMITNRIETLQTNIQKANADIARLKQEIGEVEKFKARKAELQKKVDIISNLQTGRTLPVKVFESLNTSIPEKCWIDKLDVKGDQITVSGVALNNNTIANFMTALGQSGRFQGVELGSAEQTSVLGVKLMKFNLAFRTIP
ncbi:MAG: PilN domain-containing protein [Deltaproteobacteria bacterium]|nr:PilN domain-containing protein [Candidatus Deferrimicrobiaceae bacterium]